MGTITVTTLHDELDANDTAIGTANPGGISLREALALAQGSAGADTIVFATGGTMTIDPTLEGRGGNLFLSQDIVINGDIGNDGTSDIVIDGGDASRLFYIDNGAHATLTGLTLQNGLAQGGNGGTGGILGSGGGGMGAGGAIFAATGSTLNIGDLIFGGSTADSGNEAHGGGSETGPSSMSFVAGRGGAGSGGPALNNFGGAGADCQSSPGNGGFGGGGGGSFSFNANGGNGGFGGGGGGGGFGGSGGAGGFGGGSGSDAIGTDGGRSGGGAGLGGSLFVMDGAMVTFSGNVTFRNGLAVGGGAAPNSGLGLGAGLFLQNEGVTFTPGAGQIITVADAIADATDATLNRPGTGPGGVTLNGQGTLILDAVNTFTGGTTVTAGTLGGTGTIGALAIASGGTLAPGASAGTLHTGNVTFTGGTFAVELGGTGAGQYDQLDVQGTVNLCGASLSASFINGFNAGGTFTIIANDGADTVAGQFAQGTQFSANGFAFTINYAGGDGNDVVLTVAPPAPPPPPGTTPSGGNDDITGTDGPDTIAALSGEDTVRGLAGNDLLYGNPGNDIVLGGLGDDTIYGGVDNDLVQGNEGNDLLFGNEGNDTVDGGDGNNTIVGGQDSADGADSITAGSGADLIWGNGGNDTVNADGGSNTVVGGFGNDSLTAGSAADIIFGNQGNDTINAGAGANLVFGGFGDDSVLTGSGNDTLWGNEGNDSLAGGGGADRYVFAAGSGNDQVNGFAFGEGDRLDLQGQTFTTGTSADGDVLLTLSGGGTIELNGVTPGSFSPGFVV